MNRIIQKCAICSKEIHAEPRELLNELRSIIELQGDDERPVTYFCGNTRCAEMKRLNPLPYEGLAVLPKEEYKRIQAEANNEQ